MRWSAERVVEAMRREAVRLGRTPRADDLRLADGCPSPQTVMRRFGSFREAQRKAGLRPTLSGGLGRRPRI